MRRPAHVKRVLQFHAGPRTQLFLFYACWHHSEMLAGDTSVPNFIPATGHHAEGVSPSERDDAGIGCDFCKEG